MDETRRSEGATSLETPHLLPNTPSGFETSTVLSGFATFSVETIGVTVEIGKPVFTFCKNHISFKLIISVKYTSN
jgi:hypothetical protein